MYKYRIHRHWPNKQHTAHCSDYVPIKEESSSMVVRTFFAYHRKTKEDVVIKLIERGKTVSSTVREEILLHHSCYGNPSFAQLKDIFLTENYLALVMEFVPGTNLARKIRMDGPFCEDDAKAIFWQLTTAVEFLHGFGTKTSRDIHLDNVILETNVDKGSSMYEFSARGMHAVLQEFLYAHSSQVTSDPREAFKSLPYTPPELLADADDGRSATFPSDVWRLGICLFKLVTGFFPFERPGDGSTSYRTVPVVISRIAKMDYEVPENLSESLKDLLKKIFVSKPNDRITIQEIRSHEWFQEARTQATTVEDIQRRMAKSTCPITVAQIEKIIEIAAHPMSVANSKSIDDIADALINEEDSRDQIEELTLRESDTI